MIRKGKLLICLLALVCLLSGMVSAQAAGGRVITTEPPTETPTPIATETPTSTITEAQAPQEPDVYDYRGDLIGAAQLGEISQAEAAGSDGMGTVPERQDHADSGDAAVNKPKAVETEAPSETILSEVSPEPESQDETVGNPEPGSEETGPVVNRNDDYVIQLSAETELVDAESYEYALFTRPESYHASSVLICGSLYAPEGTEIRKAEVICREGGSHTVAGSDILRLRTDFRPDSVDTLKFIPDENRCAFAFLTDLSEDNPEDGSREVTVTVTLNSGMELSLQTTVNIQGRQGPFLDVTRAVRGLGMVLNDSNETVTVLQQRLVALGYLEKNRVTGVFDETTLNAANRLLADNGMESNEGYMTSAAVGFIQSGEAAPKAENILDFLKKEITLFQKDIPVWMLVAAGAALILLILLVILLVTGRKKNASRSRGDDLTDRKAFITSAEDESAGGSILSIGDEPTMDLAAAEGVVFSEDEATTDLKETGYLLKVRMIYDDVFMDRDVRLKEGGEVIIGRDADAQIRTNPADTSVSHRHGTFRISGGALRFTDDSKNGTVHNGQRTIHKGETVTIPFRQKAELGIGAHRVLVFAVREN